MYRVEQVSSLLSPRVVSFFVVIAGQGCGWAVSSLKNDYGLTPSVLSSCRECGAEWVIKAAL